ncbi:acyl-CoA thioesterase [Thermoproteus tenax]|uniref:Acyl-CoA hydrolase n=1 Tax=Thermoproteus tenax (strain ATCC 35583 / DSM 2078 / JCM 9277 / NBRC 100435 / Kra 1) TaxID=768679 RepID=G4RNX8_THETK|nr:hotdog domain-containing protein [Thermoproteus tenax]CCC81272.1 Acyl-CoA hydrolase [Thermoproteus tenax Kra 1]
MRRSIADTKVEVTRLIAPHHVNPLGTLYGGYMLHWLVDAGSIVATDLAEANVALGYLDRMHFVEPIRVGDIVKFRSWVVYVRRSSITVLVESYVKRGDKMPLATIARMIFVKLGEDGRPEPVGAEVYAQSEWERLLLSHFSEWRNSMEHLLREERPAGDLPTLGHLLVMPEDTIYGNIMYGGKLLYYLDQLAAIAAMNFKPNIYVTASVNSINFRRPILVGDVIEVQADVDYVGRTSLEVAFKVYAKGTRGRRYVAGGYMTFVNMTGGRPTPLGEELIKDPDALRRKEIGVAEAKALRAVYYSEEEPAYAAMLRRS